MDIASHFRSDTGTADWKVEAGQLAEDFGLETAVMLSLFTEADARSGDVVPEGESPKRWWGQAYWPAVLAGLGYAEVPGLQLGSRLWLLRRAKQTEETRSRAVEYARDALAWMLALGVASAIDIAAEWTSPGWLAITVTITRPEGLPARYRQIWRQS